MARTEARLCSPEGATASKVCSSTHHLATPLLIWLLKRNDHPFIEEQGKESLNFQLSMTLYSVVGCMLLAATIVGLIAIPFFLWFLYVLNIIGVVVGAIQTSGGKHFRYSLILRFIK